MLKMNGRILQTIVVTVDGGIAEVDEETIPPWLSVEIRDLDVAMYDPSRPEMFQTDSLSGRHIKVETFESRAQLDEAGTSRWCKIVDEMENFGGPFEKALAAALRVADYETHARLMFACRDHYDKYAIHYSNRVGSPAK